MVITREEAIKNVIEYILETELEDYEFWCEENGYDPLDYSAPPNQHHIYACAMVAFTEDKNCTCEEHGPHSTSCELYEGEES
mgnify:CR=1 FL=1